MAGWAIGVPNDVDVIQVEQRLSRTREGLLNAVSQEAGIEAKVGRETCQVKS